MLGRTFKFFPCPECTNDIQGFEDTDSVTCPHCHASVPLAAVFAVPADHPTVRWLPRVLGRTGPLLPETVWLLKTGYFVCAPRKEVADGPLVWGNTPQGLQLLQATHLDGSVETSSATFRAYGSSHSGSRGPL